MWCVFRRESFSLRDLTDCSVYLLDYTSEVEVTNCNNCQIFIGPVDGPAIFDSCNNCKVAVACQQFQAKGCNGCDFGIYCATGPTLSGCSSIKISYWTGAYPGLNQHFALANLDPTKNQWNRVYDASATNDGPPNFVIVQDSQPQPWEVEIEGASSQPAENPVPSGLIATSSSTAGGVPSNPNPNANANDNQWDRSAPIDLGEVAFENGHTGLTENQSAVNAGVRDALQQRLAAQANEEAEKKAATQAAAEAFLQQFYERRNAARDSRIAQGRDELARRGSAEAGPEGSSQWERAISMIDFNAVRPGGADLSRFKAVLFAAKERS